MLELYQAYGNYETMMELTESMIVACVKALALFDFPETNAKTFSFILLGAWTLPLLLGGAVATALTRVNIWELRDRAQEGIRAMPASGQQTGL